MHRRVFFSAALTASFMRSVESAVRQNDLEAAGLALAGAIESGTMRGASLFVSIAGQELSKAFGAATSPDDLFLIASITKPMSVAALMTLYEQRRFRLEDPVREFIPEFSSNGRDEITLSQLLTHCSGLPDQLPENRTLREAHADLSKFVACAVRTPLLFKPGSKYSYSSMGILLAAEIAQRITGTPFKDFIAKAIFQPLGMIRSALGLGEFKLTATMQCQVDQAAAESGAGDPAAKLWDWNSSYWRNLGSPWGGVHASAPDIGRFLHEFLRAEGKALRPETARSMIRNHNPIGITPRGLGFAIGALAGSPGCSEQTFGHGGSTGTIAWADPYTDTICVVLTTLPAQAVNPHPRQLASDHVSRAAAGGS